MLLLDSATQAGDPTNIVNSVITWFTTNGLNAVQKIVIGAIILWVGFKLIKIIKKNLSKAFEKQNLDATLRPVILSVITVFLKVILLIVVIGYIGIPMTSFIALLGAAGLAVGMALSGTIQNFAGGIIILVFRPFKLGDYIATQGVEGSVVSIKIFSTNICTVDNKIITLPNGTLSGGNVTNYSTMETRRISVYANLANGSDIEKAEKGFNEIIERNSLILKTDKGCEPYINIIIEKGSVTVEVRVWCKGADYWAVNDYLNREMYLFLQKEGMIGPCQKITIIQ